jgi:hypothetical protein
MENLGMKNVCEKMAPQNITDNQLQWRREACADLLQEINGMMTG